MKIKFQPVLKATLTMTSVLGVLGAFFASKESKAADSCEYKCTSRDGSTWIVETLCPGPGFTHTMSDCTTSPGNGLSNGSIVWGQRLFCSGSQGGFFPGSCSVYGMKNK